MTGTVLIENLNFLSTFTYQLLFWRKFRYLWLNLIIFNIENISVVHFRIIFKNSRKCENVFDENPLTINFVTTLRYDLYDIVENSMKFKKTP